MIANTLATIARHAGETRNRRFTVKALGAAALATAAEPLAARARKGGNNRNKNTGKVKAKKRCQRQVGQCEAAVRVICAGSAGCEANLVPCCQALGQCNATGFIQCVSTPDGGDGNL